MRWIAGPPRMRMTWGMEGRTGSRHSGIALGVPGRLRMRVVPRTPAVARERIVVGTAAKFVMRMASPKPGRIFSQTAIVASGAMSPAAGPVPTNCYSIPSRDIANVRTFSWTTISWTVVRPSRGQPRKEKLFPPFKRTYPQQPPSPRKLSCLPKTSHHQS